MPQQRPRWLAFLDIEGAYDIIDRDLLWEILEEVGENEDGVKLLREIYNSKLRGKAEQAGSQFISI